MAQFGHGADVNPLLDHLLLLLNENELLFLFHKLTWCCRWARNVGQSSLGPCLTNSEVFVSNGVPTTKLRFFNGALPVGFVHDTIITIGRVTGGIMYRCIGAPFNGVGGTSHRCHNPDCVLVELHTCLQLHGQNVARDDHQAGLAVELGAQGASPFVVGGAHEPTICRCTLHCITATPGHVALRFVHPQPYLFDLLLQMYGRRPLTLLDDAVIRNGGALDMVAARNHFGPPPNPRVPQGGTGRVFSLLLLRNLTVALLRRGVYHPNGPLSVKMPIELLWARPLPGVRPPLPPGEGGYLARLALYNQYAGVALPPDPVNGPGTTVLLRFVGTAPIFVASRLLRIPLGAAIAIGRSDRCPLRITLPGFPQVAAVAVGTTDGVLLALLPHAKGSHVVVRRPEWLWGGNKPVWWSPGADFILAKVTGEDRAEVCDIESKPDAGFRAASYRPCGYGFLRLKHGNMIRFRRADPDKEPGCIQNNVVDFEVGYVVVEVPVLLPVVPPEPVVLRQPRPALDIGGPPAVPPEPVVLSRQPRRPLFAGGPPAVPPEPVVLSRQPRRPLFAGGPPAVPPESVVLSRQPRRPLFAGGPPAVPPEPVVLSRQPRRPRFGGGPSAVPPNPVVQSVVLYELEVGECNPI